MNCKAINQWMTLILWQKINSISFFNFLSFSAAQLAQILISFVVLCSFGLQFYVPMDILWRKIEPRIPKERHDIAQNLFRGGTVLVLGAIAAAIPKLDAFIGLVGAIFFSSLGKNVEFCLIFFWKKRGFSEHFSSTQATLDDSYLNKFWKSIKKKLFS